LLEHCLKNKCEFLFRVSSVVKLFANYKAELLKIKRNEFQKDTFVIIHDEMVQFSLTNKTITNRCITGIINDEEYIFVTSLTDTKHYSSQTVCNMYHARWSIETFFKEFQTFDGSGADNNKHSRFTNKKMIEFELHSKLLFLLLGKTIELESLCHQPDRSKSKRKTKAVTQTKNNLIPSMCWSEYHTTKTEEEDAENEMGSYKTVNFKKIISVLESNLVHVCSIPQKQPLLKIGKATNVKSNQDWINKNDLDILVKSTITHRPNRHEPRISKGPHNKWKLSKKTEVRQHKQKPKTVKRKGRRPGKQKQPKVAPKKAQVAEKELPNQHLKRKRHPQQQNG
jgi:hypothetical protein